VKQGAALACAAICALGCGGQPSATSDVRIPRIAVALRFEDVPGGEVPGTRVSLVTIRDDGPTQVRPLKDVMGVCSHVSPTDGAILSARCAGFGQSESRLSVFHEKSSLVGWVDGREVSRTAIPSRVVLRIVEPRNIGKPDAFER
jgi:hypothetical protein